MRINKLKELLDLPDSSIIIDYSNYKMYNICIDHKENFYIIRNLTREEKRYIKGWLFRMKLENKKPTIESFNWSNKGRANSIIEKDLKSRRAKEIK